ncbi:MAG: PBP1A family penicillin-binding protein, partial [Alphaproteobacteria bacterium]|nr:PBP1A family penicillin-binding protein [Alphaproteobacteria bacterium]
RRFFEHHGIDLRGLVRAASANFSAGAVREGGSTITQQLAKLEYAGSERTLARKVHELFIAFALERRYTKREILARYLNRVYLGAGVFGVDAAARRYFSVPPEQLTTAQSAMIAGLIRAPSATAPTANPEAAEARAGQVLDAMVETGALTPEAAAAARARPAKVVAGADVTPGINYFADWVAEQAIKLAVGSGASNAPGATDAPRGMIAQSTVDPILQRLAESALERTLAKHGAAANVSQGAIVVMTPDGAVRAMVGGRDYRASQFNRAAKARRQPGSSFKALVYLAALEAGVSPDAPLNDAPISIGGWTPANYDDKYFGPVTMETAFAQSLNSVAVQLGQFVGPERLVGIAQRLGIMSPLEPNLSLALGTSEVSLLEMMAAYGTIANGGKRVQPYGLVHVQTEDRLVHPVGPVRPDPLINPAVDDEMLRLMVAVVERGTGRGARIDRPAAGKTGTTQDYHDAWFIGFTRDLVVGVWLGNDDNSGTNKVTGGSLPAQVWHDFMTMAYATGRFGPPNQARPIVGPRPPPMAAVAYQPYAPAQPPPARAPQTNVFDEIGRGLGRAANGFLSIFR